jgi:hypothetical protein
MVQVAVEAVDPDDPGGFSLLWHAVAVKASNSINAEKHFRIRIGWTPSVTCTRCALLGDSTAPEWDSSELFLRPHGSNARLCAGIGAPRSA